MKRVLAIIFLAALLGALLVLGGCSDPGAQQREDIDDAIHEVEGALGRYYMTDPEGPVEQIDAVTARVVGAWEVVRNAAVGLDDLDTAGAEAALEGLVDASTGLDSELTAREGLRIIEPFIESFEAEVEEIHIALNAH